MKRKHIQLTIRKVPDRVDAELRRRAKKEDRSLNGVALDALRKGLGLEGQPVRYHDLDALAGTWVDDPAFDRAVADMDRVDREMWQ